MSLPGPIGTGVEHDDDRATTFQRLVLVAVFTILLAACSSGGDTSAAGVSNDEISVSAVTRSADEAFRTVPDGYVDCGSTNLASG